MDFHLSLPTTIVVIFVVSALAFLFKIFNKYGETSRKAPQAKGAWPIIGHLHLLGGSRPPHMVLGDMADEHGPIFTIKLGVHQALVVSDGEIAKDLCTGKAFANRPKAESIELMGYDGALLATAPYGDYWRKARKMLTLEVLSQRRVEMMRHIPVSEIKASTSNIYEAWVNNKRSENLDMVKVEMSDWFMTLVLKVLVRITYGDGFFMNGKEEARFQKVVHRLFYLFGVFSVSDFIPYLKFLDVGGYRKSMKKIAQELDDIIEELLKERIKKAAAYAQKPTGNQAFIDVLIQNATEDEFKDFDPRTVIKSACQQLLTAGLDTTSVTLTWALSLLLNNPKALEKAQAEIDEHVGRDRLVEESDLKNLVYLDAIIKETLRLYAPGPLSVPHESVEYCIVSGYNIPKGTRLLVNLWKIHHDPTVWSDPFEFRPERFLTTHKDIDLKGNHFELTPFGSGRRMCPAVFFALRNLGLILATVMQQFVLKRTSNEPIDMTETAGLTNVKGSPLEVLLAPRLSSNMYRV